MNLRLNGSRTTPALAPGDSVIVNGTSGKYRIRCIENFAGEPLIGIWRVEGETIIRGPDGMPMFADVEGLPRWIYESAGIQYLEEIAAYRVGNKITLISYSKLPDVEAAVDIPGSRPVRPGNYIPTTNASPGWTGQFEEDGLVCSAQPSKTIKVTAQGETYLIEVDSDGEFLRAIHERTGISTVENGRFGVLEIGEAGVRYSPFRVDPATGQITTFEPTLQPGVSSSIRTAVPAAVPPPAGPSAARAFPSTPSPVYAEEPAGAGIGTAVRSTMPVANACGIGDAATATRSWSKIISSIERGVRQLFSNILPHETAVDIGTADTLVPEAGPSAKQSAPSEKTSSLSRTAAGFFGGLATILGLHKVEEMVGLSDIPVIGKLLEGLNFFGGHVAGTSIGTGMTLSEAATLPQSLESFYRSGGTFMLLMPGIIKGLQSAGRALGLDPEDMNGIEFQAAAVTAGIGAERGIAAIGEIAVGYLERKGLTGAAGLVSRIFTRAIPGLGWGLLALDAAAELPALVHAYGQGIASLMGVSAFDFNKGILLAQRYYDARIARDPGFGFIWRRPDNYIAARNLMAEAGEEELEALKYEIDTEFYQKAEKLRNALEAVLAGLVMVDMAGDAKRQSVRAGQETVEDMIRDRISAAMAAQLPDGMAGDAMDNDCDAGEGACIDNAEASEIEDFEKFKQMVSEGYSIEEIRANFASEAEFDSAANHFVSAVIDSLGQFTPPFGSVDFGDDICKFIREDDDNAVADLVTGDVVTLWEAQNVHRMAQLLSSSMPAGGQLVADSGMITQMDEIMGFVRYDSSAGYYVFNVDSPVFQAVDAMVKAAVASMPAEQRIELLNMVIESVA
jgi:hypothetical protein